MCWNERKLEMRNRTKKLDNILLGSAEPVVAGGRVVYLRLRGLVAA